MYLCSDFVNYGTEKDCTDYNLEGNILNIHTLTLCEGEKPSHREISIKISMKEVEELHSLKTEEEKLEYVLVHQAKWCA